jgi:hypothetical protein
MGLEAEYFLFTLVCVWRCARFGRLNILYPRANAKWSWPDEWDRKADCK